jgi:hypothetical protein
VYEMVAPSLSPDLRDLIRRMSLANPRWGAARIHSELLTLGIEVRKASGAQYMVRNRTPPSQTWKGSDYLLITATATGNRRNYPPGQARTSAHQCSDTRTFRRRST